VALLAVAGGGVAYAATSGSDPRSALLNDAAKRLNVSPSDLRAALKGAASDQLDQAVKDGRLTQAQADAMKQHLQQDGGRLLGSPPPFGGPPPGLLGIGFGIGPDAAATYLGLSPAALRKRLAAGDSLADVAKAQGKSVSGLEQALVDAAKARLDKAVAAKQLTQSQADDILGALKDHVGDLVNAKPGDRPQLRMRERVGPRFFFGP
jgi:hypothetical protein